MALSTPLQSEQTAILPARAFQREWWVCVICLALLTALLQGQGGLIGFDRAIYSQWIAWTARPARSDIVLIGLDRSESALDTRGGAAPDIYRVAGEVLERLRGAAPRAIGLALPWSPGLPPAPRADAAESELALARSLEKGPRIVLAVPQSAGSGALASMAPGGPLQGFRDFRQEGDGLVRRAALAADSLGTPASPDVNWLVALLQAGGGDQPLPGTNERVIDARSGRTLRHIVGIPYSHDPRNSYPIISAAEVLSGQAVLERFRGQFVLIGSAGAQSERPVSMPGDGLFSRPEALPALQVDAQLLAALIEGRTIVNLRRGTSALLSALPAILALMAMLLPMRGSYATCAILACTLALSYGLLAFANTWFPPGAALVGTAISLPLWRWRELRATSLLLDRQFALLETQPGSFAESPFERIDAHKPSGRWRFLAAARALARVHELRRFLTRFIEDLSVPALVTNLDGHIVFANHAARDYFAALGNTQVDGAQLPYLLSTIQPDQAPANFSWWDIMDADRAQTHAGGRDPLGRDMLVWVNAWTAPGGELAGWVATLMETSAIRSAERTREDALHFLTTDLVAPSVEILRLLEETDLPQTETRAPVPSDAAHRVAIGRAAGRTLELAEKFVQLATATSHPYLFRPRPLHESIELAIDANEPYAQTRRTTIRFETDPTAPIAEIDPDMFWRALHTLIRNALRFNAPGTDVEVVLEVLDDSQEVAVRVRNHGPGITALEQARLFRMLQNIDLPSAQRGSSDLGLQFVKLVAERHRGRVEFTSNPSQGSEFSIILPHTKAPHIARRHTAASSVGAL